MYLNPKLFAMQVAILHVMLKHNPELKKEIMELTEFYQETFFIANADAIPAMQDALDYMEVMYDKP